jgi:hypothetical protein
MLGLTMRVDRLRLRPLWCRLRHRRVCDRIFRQNVQDVYFGFDRFDLTPEARATLQRDAEWLTAPPQVAFTIEGDADERGSISCTTCSCRMNGRLRLGMRYSNWEFPRIRSFMPWDGESCIRCAMNRMSLAGARTGGLIWRLGHRSRQSPRQLWPALTNESSPKTFHQGSSLRLSLRISSGTDGAVSCGLSFPPYLSSGSAMLGEI